MNKAGNNERFDADILQCKADIMRNRNIIPPHDDTASKNPEIQNNSDTTGVSNCRNAGPIPIETIPAEESPPLSEQAVSMNKKEEVEISEETSDLPRRKSVAAGIPSFDLAEEIMAEKRKISAIRRKAPGKKNEVQILKPQTRIDDHNIEQPKILLSKQEKIIAEIVARDIERLCRGNDSSE